MKFLNGFAVGKTRDTLCLLYRGPDGRLMKRNAPAEYSFYAREVDLPVEDLRALRGSNSVKGIRREDGGWLRIQCRDYDARLSFVNSDGPFVAAGIPTFEGDVTPVKRWLLDTGAEIDKPRRCYLDIETDSRVSFVRKEEMRVLCWSIRDDEGNESFGGLESDTDENEREILVALWGALAPYDQVLAWNGDRFDFPVIQARSKQRGCLPVEVRKWLWLDHLTLFKRMNTGAESGDEKQSFKLDMVAQVVLGETKLKSEVGEGHLQREFTGAHTWQEWAAGGERRELLFRYNRRDTQLMPLIEAKTGFIDLFHTVAEVCHVFPDSWGLNPVSQVDGIMLREGLLTGYHFATRLRTEEPVRGEKYPGAYVMQPAATGITKEVHVADFASLYPSIIITWNMSPDTKGSRVAPDAVTWPAGHCKSPSTGVTFRTDVQGILPRALLRLLELRKHWNKVKSSCAPGTVEWHDADRKTTAYKVTANSFYGVIGSMFSRYFDREIAESVTQNGKWLILDTKDECEAVGGTVIYIDTDSIYAHGFTEDGFRVLVDHLNAEHYPRRLKEVGCTINTVSLAYEKEYERVIFVSAKKYCGKYLHYKGKRATAASAPEVKGLEWRRGDTALLARHMQHDLVMLLVGPNPSENPTDYQEVVRTYQHKVLQGELSLDEVTLSKSIRRDLDQYAQKTKKDGTLSLQPQHVRVAKKLRERGEDVGEGTRVEFIMVDGQEVIPASDYQGNVDRFSLWEKLVWPPSMRLLAAAFPGSDWSGWGKVRPVKPKGVRAPRGPRKPQTGLRSVPRMVQLPLVGAENDPATVGDGRPTNDGPTTPIQVPRPLVAFVADGYENPMVRGLLDRMVVAMKLMRDEVCIVSLVELEHLLAREVRSPRLLVAFTMVHHNAPPLEIGVWSEWRGCEVMPTFHPRFMLDAPEIKKSVWRDLKKVLERVEELRHKGV